MDRFPEAFDRFEQDVETKYIKSFQQLFFSYMMWGGKYASMSRRQVIALKHEAIKRGIGNISVERDRLGRIHYRDVGTGRFVKKASFKTR